MDRTPGVDCWMDGLLINYYDIMDFAQQLVQANNKENIKATHHWPFVRGIHRSPVDSPHKGPVMRRAFLCNDVIIDLLLSHMADDGAHRRLHCYFKRTAVTVGAPATTRTALELTVYTHHFLHRVRQQNIFNGQCRIGRHYCYNYPGSLSIIKVTGTHLRIGHP